MNFDGDFNFVMSRTDTSSTAQKPMAENMFATVMDLLNVYDVAGFLSPDPARTWFRHRREGTNARYDRIYVTQPLLHNIKFKLAKRLGDHAPVEVNIGGQTKKKSNWKFSDAMLDKSQFKEGLHNTIKSTLEEYAGRCEDTRLEEIQNLINYEEHSSAKIFDKIVENIRKYSMDEMKKTREKRREKEEAAVNKVIEKGRRWIKHFQHHSKSTSMKQLLKN